MNGEKKKREYYRATQAERIPAFRSVFGQAFQREPTGYSAGYRVA